MVQKQQQCTSSTGKQSHKNASRNSLIVRRNVAESSSLPAVMLPHPSLVTDFNLQVENPCVILTQAVSTNFLREAKDAGKRYEVMG